jgi:hypothetical protein
MLESPHSVIASEAKQTRAVARDCFGARKSGLPDLRIIDADFG